MARISRLERIAQRHHFIINSVLVVIAWSIAILMACMIPMGGAHAQTAVQIVQGGANGTNGVPAEVAAPSGDLQAAKVGMQTNTQNSVFNGSTWDRQAGNKYWTSVTPGMPANFWSFAAPVGGYVNSTAGVTLKAAAGTGVFNLVYSGQCTSDPLGTATEIEIRSGAAGTVLWRQKVPTGGWPTPVTFNFYPPLKTGSNLLVEFAGTTASGTGGIYCDWQGNIGQ